MNKQTEALKMVIEWFEDITKNNGNEVLQACKEALEQPTQEPVAFNCKNCHACLKGVADERGLPVTLTRMIVCPSCGNKRCPKASDHRHFCTNSNDTDQAGSIYRTHPAPAWQGLSDDEIRYHAAFNFAIKLNEVNDADIDFARAIEQALKEKNNG